MHPLHHAPAPHQPRVPLPPAADSPNSTMVDFDLLLPPSPAPLFAYPRYAAASDPPASSASAPRVPKPPRPSATSARPPPHPAPHPSSNAPPAQDMSTADAQARSRAEIRRARAARNRSSARRSRLRKKAETQRDLENAHQVERRNAALKARVDALRNKVVNLQKIVNALGLVDPHDDQAAAALASAHCPTMDSANDSDLLCE